MKKNGKVDLLAIALVLGLILASCGGTQGTGEEVAKDPLAGTEWQLVFYGDPDEPTIVIQSHVPTISFEEGQAGGSGSCNSYGGSYTVEGERLQFGEMAWTEMACGEEGVMEQEMAFLSILTAVESFDLADDDLTLRGPEGNLVFKLPSAPEPQSIEGVLWQLERFVSIEGDVVAAEAALERFPITAFFGEGRLDGTTGCNNYGAAYTIDGERIEFPDAFFMTQAECLDEGANQQEARFMQSIQAVQSYRVADDALILAFPGGELIFRSLPEPGTGQNAVYEALLADWGEGPFVIRDQTAFNGPDISLEDTLDFVQGQLSNMGEEDPFALQDETLEDFRAKNAEAVSLRGELQTRFSTTVLTEAELQERFGEDGEIDWAALEGEFPGTEGIYSLSQVGFNAAGDQALVYLGLQSEDFTGGWYSLMVKDRGRWMATISFMVWER
jgi:heat shock protein HslJ